MTEYSVAEARDGLSALIDKAAQGEEVVITRHGKPVVQLHPANTGRPDPAARAAIDKWLIERRKARKSVDISSVDLLNEMYESDEP